MSKTTKIIAALGVVAGLGVAALPVAGASANTTQQTDNLSVTIADSCQLTYGSSAHAAGTGTYKGTWDNTTNTLSTTIANNAADPAIGSTTMHVVCNDLGGYRVNLDSSDLTGTTNTSEKIEFAASTPTAGTSSWGVSTGTTPTWIADGGVVTSANKATAVTGADFTVTYGVATSTDQAADTYKGTAQYDLTHPANK